MAGSRTGLSAVGGDDASGESDGLAFSSFYRDTDGNGASGAAPVVTDERADRAIAAAAGVKAPPRNLRTNQPTDGAGGQTVVAAQKVGRNEPCPCGSGKKYKKCHGAA